MLSARVRSLLSKIFNLSRNSLTQMWLNFSEAQSNDVVKPKTEKKNLVWLNHGHTDSVVVKLRLNRRPNLMGKINEWFQHNGHFDWLIAVLARYRPVFLKNPPLTLNKFILFLTWILCLVRETISLPEKTAIPHSFRFLQVVVGLRWDEGRFYVISGF